MFEYIMTWQGEIVCVIWSRSGGLGEEEGGGGDKRQKVYTYHATIPSACSCGGVVVRWYERQCVYLPCYYSSMAGWFGKELIMPESYGTWLLGRVNQL